MKKLIILLLIAIAFSSGISSVKGQTIIQVTPDQPTYVVSSEFYNSLLEMLTANTASPWVYVKSFHPGGTAGGGFFIQTTGTADNVTIYKGLNGKVWRRASYRNTPQSYGAGDGEKYLTYGPAHLSLIYPASVGALVGDSYDWAAIMTMRYAQANGIAGADIVQGNFYINRTLTFYRSKFKDVYENWAKGYIYKKGIGSYPVMETFGCATKKECTDTNTNYSYKCLDLNLVGNGFGKGIALYGWQFNEIAHSDFRKCDTAIFYGFCMNSIIHNNEFFDDEYPIWIDRLTAKDCSTDGCQSNVNRVTQNRFNITPGTQVCITVIDASDILIELNSAERNSGGTARKFVQFNSMGAPVIKAFDIDSMIVMNNLGHVEATFTEALFDFRVTAGSIVKVRGPYVQYACNLIRCETISGYSHCIVEDVPYLPTGTTFESIGPGMRWSFIRVLESANKTILWKGIPGTIKEISYRN